MILRLFYIAIIIVYAIDVSPFYRDVTGAIASRLTKGRTHEPIRLKPFSCSLCMTFWVGLIYLIIKGQLSMCFLVVLCGVSALTPAIAQAFDLVLLTIEILIDYAKRKIDR